jgi:uncharacterized protein with PQ loop repeat
VIPEKSPKAIMKQTSMKQTVSVGILGFFVAAALFALILTYLMYLPTITSVPLNKADASLAQAFYLIARNAFLISAVSGVVLGFLTLSPFLNH